MSEYLFEKVKEEHVSKLLEIYSYYIINTTATFHCKVLTQAEMKELLIFSDERYQSFVIMDKQNIIGYCILTHYSRREAFGRTGEITIYLRHDYTGRGIGNIAINYIEEVAKSKGFHVLLALICGENSRSISAFERNGYVKCALYKEVGYKFGRWLDMVACQKIID